MAGSRSSNVTTDVVHNARSLEVTPNSTAASHSPMHGNDTCKSPLNLLNSTLSHYLENESFVILFQSLTIALYVRYLSPPWDKATVQTQLDISFERPEHRLIHTSNGSQIEPLQLKDKKI